jgi:hypothetical protein
MRCLSGWRTPRVAAALLACALPATAGAEAFSKASLYFELNHTDGDLGIHAQVDGDPWRVLAIDDPGGARLLDIDVKARLRTQGLTELSFESAEPTFDKLPPKEFFARFPEGEYKITGTTLDGKALASLAKLSHVIPAPAANIRVSGAAVPKDCEKGPVPSAAQPVVITWSPVTASHPDLGKAGPVRVEKYEVVVGREKPTPLSFSVELPGTATSFEVPKNFVALAGAEPFKLEILGRATNGNQTAIESCFKVK